MTLKLFATSIQLTLKLFPTSKYLIYSFNGQTSNSLFESNFFFQSTTLFFLIFNSLFIYIYRIVMQKTLGLLLMNTNIQRYFGIIKE